MDLLSSFTLLLPDWKQLIYITILSGAVWVMIKQFKAMRGDDEDDGEL